jgi:adenylosuccinate lyase
MKTPLDSRYSSPEMKKLFSARSRYSIWRKLWYFLAQAQKEVGLAGISDQALAQMADHLTVTDEDFAVAAVEEAKRRHDVVSLHAL